MNRARVSRNSLTLDSFSREIISREGGEGFGRERRIKDKFEDKSSGAGN